MEANLNLKFHTSANGETGYHAHAKAFWLRLEKFNDNSGVPINIVLDTSDHPIFYKKYEGIKICYNVYESTIQPERFFNHIKDNWDYFWCPSQWQKNCLVSQGFPENRVHVVPEGVDGKEFFPVHDLDLADKFTFIIVGKWEYRKSTKEMINCWFEEFPIEKYPDIRLILSVDNWFDRVNVERYIKEIEDLNDPRVRFVHFPPREEYVKLLQTSHCFLSCSRSEGWNLPLIEAIACGVPSIALNYSAQAEFSQNIAHLVNVKGMKSTSINNFPGEYAEPDFEHFKLLLKYIYDNWNECRQKALIGSNFIKQQYSWEKAVETSLEYLKEIESDYKQPKQTSIINEDIINVNFIDGARIEISGNSNKRYDVKFIDKANNSIVYSTNLTPTQKASVCWAMPNAKYFVNWKIEATTDEQVENVSNNQDVSEDTIFIKKEESKITTCQFVRELDLKDKRVFINLESKALGDNLAWIPYVEQFREKHGCKIIATTFWNQLFKDQYPEIEFVVPGTTAHDLCAQYRVGCYDDNYDRNKNNWRETPLQKIAADVLGLNYREVKPKISVSPVPRTGRKYVCISDHSTMRAKFWNYPGGWQQIIDYLGDLAYDVVAVSKDPTGLTKLVPVNNNPIENIASIINNCEFFIGVGSGLSWLAWALNKKVIMISGFSDPFTEFQSNNYRIAPPLGACHGCFNDKSLTFDRSWNWCPRNKDFECTKLITPEMVKEKIDLLISHL